MSQVIQEPDAFSLHPVSSVSPVSPDTQINGFYTICVRSVLQKHNYSMARRPSLRYKHMIGVCGVGMVSEEQGQPE